MILTLDEPIEFGGKSWSEIVLREPKVREIAAAFKVLGGNPTPESMVRFQNTLVASVSGVHERGIEQMPIRLFQQAVEYLQSFLSGSLLGGGI
nr:phage tail assembly protein [Roseicella sp. DB1501]